MRRGAGTLCGEIVDAVDVTIPGLVGRTILADMAPVGAGRWAGGKIWAPNLDRVFDARMQAEGNRLRVEGCVSIVCRGQTWSRVN